MIHDPRDVVGIVRDELEQRRTSGHDGTALEALLHGLATDAEAPWLTGTLPAALVELAPLPAWPYEEPDTEAGILAAVPGPSPAIALRGSLADRIHGAWLGRCAGCLLGKPIEGWRPDEVEAYLRFTDAWPPRGYLRAPGPDAPRFPAMKPSWPVATAGAIAGMPRDDDIDYTLLGLHVLETHGLDAGRDALADELLDRLPFTQVFTAERVAYRNLVLGYPVDDAGWIGNPYREWIGAMIRADVHGLTAPGMPTVAARSALRDAWLTHRANGAYAAMWAAATLSAAVAGVAPRAAAETGLAAIPRGSRSAAAVRDVMRDADEGMDWEERLSRLRARFADYGWVHAIPNLAAVAAAVIHGDGDLERTIGFAVAAGWDTDSAGATAGAIAGACTGAARLPARWCDPLEDRIASAVRGYPEVRISDAAARTQRLAQARLASGVA